MSEQLPLNT